jgi:hypothetical protein
VSKRLSNRQSVTAGVPSSWVARRQESPHAHEIASNAYAKRSIEPSFCWFEDSKAIREFNDFVFGSSIDERGAYHPASAFTAAWTSDRAGSADLTVTRERGDDKRRENE